MIPKRNISVKAAVQTVSQFEKNVIPNERRAA